MANRIGFTLVNGSPVDHLSESTPADWWAWIWTHISTNLPPIEVMWGVGALAVLLLAFLFGRATLKGLRSLTRLTKAYLSSRSIEDVLTIVAASIATGVSATGMWRFAEDVLHLPFLLRVLLFAFIEVAIVTSAVRARRNMRENFSAGVDGMAVWALTVLTAVLSSMDARSLPEAIFRLAAPLVAAWLWERGMAIERHRIRGTKAIHWRFTLERAMVLLGLAEASDRTAGEVDRQRRITRTALAVLRVDDQQDAKKSKQRKALADFRTTIAKAVEHAGLATDPEAQQALLAQIDTLRSADALVQRKAIASWANPVTQAAKAEAQAAMEELTRLDTAEATQRALDKAAVTLMALTERVTSDVTSARVNAEVTSPAVNGTIPAPRNGHPLISPMTSALTPEVTVERVNDGLNFDVTNLDAYALEKLLAEDPYMTHLLTPALTAEVTARDVNNEVNEDAPEASKTQVMRDFWDSEVAEDRYPTVKDLAAHAEVDPAHASRKRREWVAELPWRKRRRADPKRDKTPS